MLWKGTIGMTQGLIIKNLSLYHKYEKTTLVNNVSLSIAPSEIVAVVGASGSGKSLLAHSILHLLPEEIEQTCEMLWNGETVNQHNIPQLRGKEIALIPQTIDALDPFLKVGKYLLTLMKGKNKQHRLHKIWSSLGLDIDWLTYFPFELSGGMARRVLIASALVQNPNLILADEPTPGVDAGTLSGVLAPFNQMKQEGKSVLFITHDFFAALKVADRIAVMDHGEIIEVSPVSFFAGDGEKLKHTYTKALWQALPQNCFVNNWR